MLDKIIHQKRIEVENIILPPYLPFKRKSLFEAIRFPKREIGLIAEVKKASPSKGIIRKHFEPLRIAQEYENAKADAISVLTDEVYFQGSIDYLIAIKEKVNLPVLRKDFIINSKQIEQSKRIGADAILLIGEVLSPQQLFEFYQEAYEKGLECLVEVHSQDTIEQILKLFTPKIIGINNRNLKTFETGLSHTKDISTFIPDESLLVSESGIHTPENLQTVREFGADAVLVGEALMRVNSPGEGIHKLFGEQKNEEAVN